MSRRIDFYYDVISPYTYLGFEILCRHRPVWDLVINLRPFYLAGIMKGANNQPPGMVPARGQYLMRKDLPRLARHYGVPLAMSETVLHAMFTKGTLSTMRFITAVQLRHPPTAVESLTRQLFLRMFNSHQDVTEAGSLVEAALKAGLTAEDATAALAEAQSDAVKAKLKANTDEALEIGAFGSPVFVVHTAEGKKEMVFGSDRFHIIGDLLGVEYKGPLKHLAAKI